MVDVLEELGKLTRTEIDSPVIPLVQQSTETIELDNTPPSVEQPPEPNAGINSEEELMTYIASQLGVDDYTPQGQGADAIVELAKYKLSQIQNQYQGFENQDVIAFKQHLENGGDFNSFRQLQSLENEYEDIQFNESNVTDHEKFAKWLYTDIQGIHEDDADSLIERRKDNGSLLDFCNENLEVLKSNRQKEINDEQYLINTEIEANKQAALAFQQEVDNAFTTNNFNGVKLNSQVLGEVRKMINPNERGQIPLQDVVNNFNGSQHTLLNYFAYCLANNLPIEYKPVNSKPSGVGSPIHQLLGKVNSSTKGDVMSLGDLSNLIKGNK